MSAVVTVPERFVKAIALRGWEMDDHGAVVYVIAPDENGPCKIGYTTNIGLRHSAIQVGCWLPLGVFAVRVCFKREGGHWGSLWESMVSGARYVESEVHAKLKELDCHLNGEWFDLTPKEAVQAVEKVSKENNAAALTLNQVAELELGPMATRLEKDTLASLTKSLYCANDFARRSLTRLA